MQKPVLIVMAAGMGSRYGGLKQVDPVGPNGQAIIDYSLYDARRAGFERAIFIISPAMEADFPGQIAERVGKYMDVQCTVQHLQDVPARHSIPQDRVKPWGTGHAVRASREVIDTPFAVINADDYYGLKGLEAIYGFLKDADHAGQGKYAMVGYELTKTLSKTGYVSRGICRTDEGGKLQEIHERKHIVASSDGPLYTEDMQTYTRLPEDTIASMNLWGFTPDFMGELDTRFDRFLERVLVEDPLKSEYFLPEVVEEMLQDNAAEVTVLTSPDNWFGVTYREDRPVVARAIEEMTSQGLYPEKLW